VRFKKTIRNALFAGWCILPESPDARLLPENPAEYVVLLHGLGRTSISMKGVEWTLRREGYTVINVAYPSTRVSIESAATRVQQFIDARLGPGSATVHFVTHSLGGIVLREYLAKQPKIKVGRVVMIAPPNQGSEIVDRFKSNPLFRLVTGPTGQQLGTEATSLPNSLVGLPAAEIGIIAGDRSINPCLARFIPGPNDGKVSVTSAQLNGMKDFLLVHKSHTWIMWDRSVLRATTRFIARGTFVDGRIAAP
jgi:pimeloyl-ACP methyl ester carboxylesterase